MPALPAARADEFLALLQERLPEKTYRHVRSVTDLMVRVAEREGLDPDRAVTAGLLHDLCKAMKPEELLRRAEAWDIEIRPSHREKPALLHGPAAAEEARRMLGVTDDEVYDAVYWHTTGRPNWGKLGQALYICDFSEPLRPFPEAEEARRILETDGFDAALCYVADVRLANVRRKPVTDPMTEAFHH